ncbi:MAG TPA: glycosyltransferase [Acidimicrobiales bacterium]|nr:glycosyltransferase [Acidimicrobiales bacterium]
MRVLVAHNRYSSRVPSGENLAVDDEVRWLRAAGVDVVVHEVSNDDAVDPGPLARVRQAGDAVWSLPARRRFLADLDAVRPDIVHVHNLFPLLSASVPAAAHRRDVPVAWTVHNRRVRCVAGGYFRDGAPCHQCRPGWRAPGVVHRCYAGSAAASTLVTASSSLFLARARRGDVTPIAPSRFMAAWLTSAAGLDPASVQVKYNGVARAPAGEVTAGLPADRRVFLFAGRLAAYKGVRLLLDAWRHADLDAELHILGDGDLAPEVEAAAAHDDRITWVGSVEPERVGTALAAARTVVVPSLWDEPFGRVAAEALAHGRPVITTGRGGLAEIVDDTVGWITGDAPVALAGALAAAMDDAAVAHRAAAARRRHADRFSPEATTAALVALYERLARRR